MSVRKAPAGVSRYALPRTARPYGTYLHLFAIVFLRRFGKGVLIFVFRMIRQLALDFLNPLNKQFKFRFLFPGLSYLRYRRHFLQIVGIGTGEPE